MFLNPPASYLSIDGGIDHREIKSDELDVEYFELRKFIKLCLKSNPTVLEILYSPIVKCNSYGLKLVDNADVFMSQNIYYPYVCYAKDQYKKMLHNFETGNPRAYKNASHIIRLLIAANHALMEGEILVDMFKYRDLLLSIKLGNMSVENIEKNYSYWLQKCDESFIITNLPRVINRERVDKMVREIYGSYLGVSEDLWK